MPEKIHWNGRCFVDDRGAVVDKVPGMTLEYVKGVGLVPSGGKLRRKWGNEGRSSQDKPEVVKIRSPRIVMEDK